MSDREANRTRAEEGEVEEEGAEQPSQTPQTTTPTPPPTAQNATLPPNVLQNLLEAFTQSRNDNASEFLPQGFRVEHLDWNQFYTGGPPPAAPSALADLDEVVITRTNQERIGDCAVCTEPFKIGSEALKLPCKHYFHHDCINEWLRRNNRCPLCRHELPTLDEDYEARKRTQDEEPYNSRSTYSSSMYS